MRRRRFLTQSAQAAALAALPVPVRLFGQAPGIVTSDAARPQVPFGVQSGDVGEGVAVVWSRTDRPARLVVEYSTHADFSDARRVVGPVAFEDTDYTARIVMRDLPAGQRVGYRVLFQDLGDLRTYSTPVEGSFRTPPALQAPRDVSFAWGADVVGQGWGIDVDRGGLKLFETMRRHEPDIFVHCGDTIYADQPLLPEVKLDDGTIWRNLVTPEKSKVAETLDEYRGNYRYNLLDPNLRRFNAAVPTMAIWDDHEVRDNWYDARPLERDTRYTEKRMALLAARARRAFLDYLPLAIDGDEPERIYRSRRYGKGLEIFGWDMRSYRGPNTPNRQQTLTPESMILGAEQVAWLKRSLKASTATWKVIASDMPIGLIVPDGPSFSEAVANGDPGAASGRELEIADLLAFIQREKIRNVFFVTGDVHYCAAYHYDPARAAFRDFDPFWEFVGGPIHAGTFGPNALDGTFGPEARFIGIPPGMKPNRPPSDGFQFFGLVKVDARSEVATVSLHNLEGTALYTLALEPQR